jgi:cytochrome P450/NADPH-cytochrome P450 reductase
MLNGRDPQTGEAMTDDSITDNMITFLIAGHETTSGMLTYIFYFLLKSPTAYQKAQQEVDSVIGKGPINVDHLSKLPYINAVC